MGCPVGEQVCLCFSVPFLGNILSFVAVLPLDWQWLFCSPGTVLCLWNAGCCRWYGFLFCEWGFEELFHFMLVLRVWAQDVHLGKSAQTGWLSDPCFSTHPAWLHQTFLLFKPTGSLWTHLLHRLFLFSHLLLWARRHLLFYMRCKQHGSVTEAIDSS